MGEGVYEQLWELAQSNLMLLARAHAGFCYGQTTRRPAKAVSAVRGDQRDEA